MGISQRAPTTWNPTSWGEFPFEVFNTAQAPQSYSRSVVDTNTFSVTGTGAGNESHRVIYMARERSADSEITSRWGPHSAFTGLAPQVGHVHRARMDASGLWHAIAVWQNIFGNAYSTIIVKAIRFDGTTLTQGNTPGSFLAPGGINRNLRVLAAANLAGFNVRQYFCTPVDLQGMVNGDLVTVAQMDDTGFNVASALPVSNVDITAGTFTVTGTGDGTKDETSMGQVTFADGGKAANWGYMVKSRVEGTRVRVKQWRNSTPEPNNWHIDLDVGADTTVPEVAVSATKDGQVGLWFGHLHDNAYGRMSNVSITHLR